MSTTFKMDGPETKVRNRAPPATKVNFMQFKTGTEGKLQAFYIARDDSVKSVATNSHPKSVLIARTEETAGTEDPDAIKWPDVVLITDPQLIRELAEQGVAYYRERFIQHEASEERARKIVVHARKSSAFMARAITPPPEIEETPLRDLANRIEAIKAACLTGTLPEVAFVFPNVQSRISLMAGLLTRTETGYDFLEFDADPRIQRFNDRRRGCDHSRMLLFEESAEVRLI